MVRRIQRIALARVGFPALLGALVALGPVAALSSTPSTASAAIAPTAGACGNTTGITVVVDMTAFDGGVQVRCAPQPVHSGFEALTRAGFDIEGTRQFPGLLCRIDGKPTKEQFDCVHAPPANSYWAYWHAPRGGDWTYSTSGAGSRVPPPGSVEGWAFGDDAEPGVDPPDAPPATTTTRPTTVTTTRSSGGGTDGGATGGAIGGSTTTTHPDGSAPTTSKPEAAAGDSTTTSSDASSGDAADDERDTEQAAGATSSGGGDGSGGGSPLGAIVGLTVAGALMLAGIRAARRRRSVDEELA